MTRCRDGSLIVPNSSEVTVGRIGLEEDQARLFVKDLGKLPAFTAPQPQPIHIYACFQFLCADPKCTSGPQISWRVVYVIEYLGPIFIHPLVYRIRLAQPLPAQTLTLYMVMMHFIKREFETIFIHRFSNATMPFKNVFKNSFHYWVLSGALLAWAVYTPTAIPSSALPSPGFSGLFSSLPLSTHLGLGLYLVGSFLNARVHLIQRRLRRPGTSERGIPDGPGFAWVTCPNYMFETLTWVGVLVVSRNWASALFIVVAIVQMKAWADKKEARYRQEFGEKYRAKRYTVLPGIC